MATNSSVESVPLLRPAGNGRGSRATYVMCAIFMSVFFEFLGLFIIVGVCGYGYAAQVMLAVALSSFMLMIFVLMIMAIMAVIGCCYRCRIPDPSEDIYNYSTTPFNSASSDSDRKSCVFSGGCFFAVMAIGFGGLTVVGTVTTAAVNPPFMPLPLGCYFISLPFLALIAWALHEQ